MKGNIVDKIKLKIQYHSEQSAFHISEEKRFKDILFAVENLDLEALPKESSVTEKLGAEVKETFKASICNILKGDKKMSSQEILKEFNKRTGKGFTLNQFSGRLSQLVDDVVVKHVDEGKPMAERNTYSLKK